MKDLLRAVAAVVFVFAAGAALGWKFRDDQGKEALAEAEVATVEAETRAEIAGESADSLTALADSLSAETDSLITKLDTVIVERVIEIPAPVQEAIDQSPEEVKAVIDTLISDRENLQEEVRKRNIVIMRLSNDLSLTRSALRERTFERDMLQAANEGLKAQIAELNRGDPWYKHDVAKMAYPVVLKFAWDTYRNRSDK